MAARQEFIDTAESLEESSIAELAEVNHLLARLSDLLSKPKSPEGRRLHALAWVLAPIAAQPMRRENRNDRVSRSE